MTPSLVLLVCLLKTHLAGAQILNDRPIVGVLAQESRTYHNRSVITASYVKFLEASGARVVPIFTNQSDEYYQRAFKYTNGVLFPGGNLMPDSNFAKTGYARAGKYMFDLAVKANKEGDYYPIWGTCLGLELLSILLTNGSNPLTRCSAEDVAAPLNFILDDGQLKKTRLFRDADSQTVQILKVENVTINYHDYCLLWETLRRTSLAKLVEPISINEDSNKTTFVSVFEAKLYPFYAVQFHPEIVLFEFQNIKGQRNVPHNADSIAVSQYFSRFFVNEARKSGHRFPSEREEEEWLIYNYSPKYTGVERDSSDEQVYFFT